MELQRPQRAVCSRDSVLSDSAPRYGQHVNDTGAPNDAMLEQQVKYYYVVKGEGTPAYLAYLS
jgi:hypothetical protein